ncbi:MAG: hypothetical protein Q8897_01985 [Sweet potato little leaf phytoplasma]|uniref:hypothetical protein n=1 Tax=Candidatus Phytoplasma australasiaticum TaxID=2754999 RepID=UPI0027134921|nr:hypothetical protein [Sweet potato little leaf phytoplasma]MDV3201676.1 hypothetical protein [Candidatus Phytoplasma australasiaticum]MDO8005514.1 hypothetical protein [Sweet potato little leaf phytoplasma]MDO8020539.1 hypothetical protein [Sweet potato little leaf phytoplasma]MDV3139932.1 hypothetical protein [Sweet potato little leaf phytoplasma]MDV3140892.1 hypothetical protein [Sweet potato little leaf phytoplasma]
MKNKIKQLRFIPGLLSLLFVALCYIIMNNNILLAHLTNNSAMLSDSVALTNQDINNLNNEQKSKLLKIFYQYNNKLSESEPVVNSIPAFEAAVCFQSLDNLVAINQNTFYSDVDDIAQLNNIAADAKDIITSSSHDSSLSTIQVNNLKDTDRLNQLLSNCSRDIVEALTKLIFKYHFGMLLKLAAQTPGVVALTIATMQ